MADTVDVQKLSDGPRNVVYRFTSLSDSTGESDVKKIDLSTLSNGPDINSAATSLSLLFAEWDIQTTNGGSVLLEWDADTDDEIIRMSGTGEADYRPYGGLHSPRSTGHTGDILLTTNSFANGDSYNITVHFRKKA